MPEISPAIKVNGAPLADLVRANLVSVEVDRGVNLVGRATLKFVEPAFDVVAQPKFPLAAQVEIGIFGGSQLFKGEVTAISLDQEAVDLPVTTFTVTVDDLAYKLGRETQHRAFLNQSYTDVVTSFAGEVGMTAQVESAGATEEYIMQSGTNLAFLDWVASRFGLLWWVDDGKLYAAKPSTSGTPVTMKLGNDLLRLSSRASGRHPGKVTVTGWDDKQQVAVTSTAATTKTPESDLVTKAPGRATQPGTGMSIPGRALTVEEAQDVSGSLLAQAASAAVTTRGTSWVNAAVKPGGSVEVTQAGPASGTYLVTRVQHVYSNAGFHTHFVAGPLRPNSLVDLLGSPPAPTGEFAGGLVAAVVTNNLDNENKHPGMVKVKFPTLGAGVESQWARVVTLGGGSSRGIVFHPEVNDEVLVGFEGGDTRRPVVLGGLYSDKNKLPSTDNVESGKVNYRRITSRLGHIIELYDGADAATQHIQLKTKGGHIVRLGEDKLEIKVSDKPVSITNGPAKIEFSDSGDITIQGANITIKADQAVKIEAGSEASVKGTTAAKIEGAQVDVKASTKGSIDGGGMLGIKGGMVAIN